MAADKKDSTGQPLAEDDPDAIELPPEAPLDSDARLALAADIKAQAATHFKAGRFRCALKLYSHGQMLDPSNMVVPLNMAAAHLELDEHGLCCQCCTDAISIGTAVNAEAALLAKAHLRHGKALAGLAQ